MKKLFFCCLLAGTVLSMSAQNTPNWYFNQNGGWSYSMNPSRSDQYFTPPFINQPRHNFYIGLPAGNSIRVQVSSKEQLLMLLNIDSVITSAWSAIKVIKDSLNAGTNNIKIEYATDQAGIVRIRTAISEDKRKHYVFQKNELAALKIEQDTIIISGIVKQDSAVRTGYRGIYKWLPYRITFLLNSFEQLGELQNNNLNTAMEQIRSEWNSNDKWNGSKSWKYHLSGYYNITDPSKNRRMKDSWSSNKYRSSIAPFVQISVQAINNRFSPSVGAGMEWVTASANINNHFQLFWEPYFYFDQTLAGKNKLHRNDFVSFQYFTANWDKNDRTKVLFSQNISFSYLVHRSGSFLEPNTFKFGLPGARYRDVFLHPEFVFNKFFKDFQPSLKLMLYLD